MPYCPTCGRRNARASAAVPVPLPLFDWIPHAPLPRRPTGALARLLLLHGYLDAEGEPRPALLIPGQRLPVAFRTIAAPAGQDFNDVLQRWASA